MLKNSIKISDDTKALLDDIQGKFNIKTYDSSVLACAKFILRNEINLKEDYIGDYRRGLIDLENRLGHTFKNHEEKVITNYASIRKWLGAMEKDYFKPLLKKLETLDKINDYNFVNFSKDNINKPKPQNPLNLNLAVPEQVDIPPKLTEALDMQKDEKFKEVYRKYENQKQALFKIFNNAKIEAGGMMSKEKIVINLSVEEWEELKNNFQ